MADRSPGAVLVTGGAGYVGASTARALLRSGRRVVVLDDLSSGHAEAAGEAPLVVGDVGDEALLAALIRQHRVTAVIHLAGRALVGESMRAAPLYDRENRAKTAALTRAAVRGGVRALVFTSTAAVYGPPTRIPVDEAHPRHPVSPYGASKAAAEDLLLACGIPTAVLRCFNVAGALPEHGLAERHDPETHLLPRCLDAARGGAPVVVHGTDHPTPDGTCVRDYVHVADVAAGHAAALARLESVGLSGVWNLASGSGTSVREVIAVVAEVLGRRVPAVDGPRRSGDPARIVGCPLRARRDLGWEPRLSTLRRIVTDAAVVLPAATRSGAVAPRPCVVAIDGPAGVGKSTLARRLAADLGWAYLDSGAMYRALALAALRGGVPTDDAEGLAELARRLDLVLSPDGRTRVGGHDVSEAIRRGEVTEAVARVAALPPVRRVMVAHQRRFAATNGRIVAEGRDMGTAVFPEAAVKVYLDARPVERAARRRAQEPGSGADVRQVLERLEDRDRRDRSRPVGALRPSPEAWRLDTTRLTPDQVFAAVRSHVRSKIPAGSGGGDVS